MDLVKIGFIVTADGIKNANNQVDQLLTKVEKVGNTPINIKAKIDSSITAAQKTLKDLQAKRKGKADQPVDLEEAEETLIKSAVARIVTWKGLEDGGKVVEPTQENFVRIMTELDWVRKQVLDESDNDANFI